MQRLLLVEDDADMLWAFQALLEKDGYGVTAVPTAEHALGAMQSERFDMIITDLLLPGIDGAELCRTLRADDSRVQIPVVLVTSMKARMGIEITGDDFQWAPFTRVIDKGFGAETLLRAVHDLLDGERCTDTETQ